MSVFADGREVPSPRLSTSEAEALARGEAVEKRLRLEVGDRFLLAGAPVMCRWRRGRRCSLRRMSGEELEYALSREVRA